MALSLTFHRKTDDIFLTVIIRTGGDDKNDKGDKYSATKCTGLEVVVANLKAFCLHLLLENNENHKILELLTTGQGEIRN